MAAERTITVRAGRADGRMDIADLREFLASLPDSAHANGRIPKVRRNLFGFGAIKSISVTLTREDDDG